MKPTPIRIHTLEDPRVAPYRNLRDAHLAADTPASPGASFMAEGEIVVRQLIRSRHEIASVLLTPTRLATVADALDELPASVPVYLAEQEVMDGITGFHIHRGVLAAGVRPPPADPDRLIRESRLLVVLEDLANHDNLGGVFRNAAAFGADAVLLSPRCADPLYRKALRVSVGLALRVPFARLSPWPAALGALRGGGFTVVGLTPDPAAMPLSALSEQTSNKMALLLGAEGPGLSAPASAAVDLRVRIPMATEVDSLNVSVASGIALARVAGSV